MGYPETYNELEQWRDHLRATLPPEERIRALEERVEREADLDRQEILNFFLSREHIAQGRPDVAKAVRSRDPSFQTYDWYEALRKADEDADRIPILHERLLSETHPRKLSTLRHLLSTEYQLLENYAAAAALELADFHARPDHPMPLISLAGIKLYCEDEPEEAMRIIEQAVDVAMRAGIFRRYALGVKGRVALRLQDYRAVENVLKQLLALTFTRGNMDLGVERDFLDNLPPGSIDPELARQYHDYCCARGKPRLPPDPSQEPPKMELPEWEGH